MAEIKYYEDIHRIKYDIFLQRRVKPAPVAVDVESIPAARRVDAYINHGRWVVECPEACGDAVLASRDLRVYACGTEGCTSEGYYHVAFPRDSRAIERELLKRPAHPSGMPVHANWRPGETLANIRAENTEHGVDSG